MLPKALKPTPRFGLPTNVSIGGLILSLSSIKISPDVFIYNDINPNYPTLTLILSLREREHLLTATLFSRSRGDFPK